MKHIVIVGGSFAGVSTAHRILKQAAKPPTAPFKVILVSRDTHFYWNIAAPRAILPGQIPDDKLFQPIAAGFSHYPKGQFEFILGSATGIDVEANQLEISKSDIKTTKLDYDYLILGSGSKAKEGLPLKSLGSTNATKTALHDFQERVGKAKTIVVVGAGPTGVEIAGELGFLYGKTKRVVLISSGPTILEGRPASVSQTAIKYLKTINVEIKTDSKVNTPVPLADGRQELTLSGASKLAVDLYIPTFGVEPNSSYVPDKFLDDKGFVIIDEYFKVKGTENIFALGDVSNVEPPQFFFVDKQTVHLAKNFILILSGKPQIPYKAATSGMVGLQIGRKSGTGHYGNIKLPSFLVTMLRKTLFVENLPRTVDGSML